MEVNAVALRRRFPGSESMSRYGEIGEMLTGTRGATAEDGIAFIRGPENHQGANDRHRAYVEALAESGIPGIYGVDTRAITRSCARPA
jgi:DNA-binding LacI/PurR family transcriptional regulator